MRTALTVLFLLTLTGLIPALAAALGWGAVITLAAALIAADTWLREHERREVRE